MKLFTSLSIVLLFSGLVASQGMAMEPANESLESRIRRLLDTPANERVLREIAAGTNRNNVDTPVNIEAKNICPICQEEAYTKSEDNRYATSCCKKFICKLCFQKYIQIRQRDFRRRDRDGNYCVRVRCPLCNCNHILDEDYSKNYYLPLLPAVIAEQELVPAPQSFPIPTQPALTAAEAELASELYRAIEDGNKEAIDYLLAAGLGLWYWWTHKNS